MFRFSFTGGTAIGTGRGTAIEQIDDFDSNYILIATPGVAAPTSKGYASLGLGDLTMNSTERILKLYRDETHELYKGKFEFQNDFESVIFNAYSEIENTAELLVTSGANTVLLSGSGSSVFAIYDEAQALHEAAGLFEQIDNVHCYCVRTVSRRSYCESLGLSPESGFSF